MDKETLEKDMASRGFIDWRCPDWLLDYPYDVAISIAIDMQCGWSKEYAIFYATQ